jgi:hypothetical protein
MKKQESIMITVLFRSIAIDVNAPDHEIEDLSTKKEIDLAGMDEEDYKEALLEAGDAACSEAGYVFLSSGTFDPDGRALITYVEPDEYRVTLAYWIWDHDDEFLEPFVTTGMQIDPEFFRWCELFSNRYIPPEAVLAARSLGYDPDSAEEAYQGHYRTDVEFAQQFAEDMGLIQPNLSWPYSSLDWSDAAAELMQDYCEEDGYYFRR